MSLLLNTQSKNAASFYNGVTSSSLRANHGDSSGLKRTGVTGTSRRIFTHSSWVKRTGIQTNTEALLQVSPNNNDTGTFQFGFRDEGDSDGPNVQVSHYNGSAFDFRVETTAKLRDCSSWYHLVLRVDTTQGTDTNRVRIYINGVEQTDLAQDTYPSQNFDTSLNVANTIHYMAGGAAANAGGGNVYFDSYVTEINYVDGLSLGPDSFGEFNNGIWIPINTGGLTFGNNGARLQFKNSGTATTGQGTTATTNIGDDSSGNGHNFAVLNYVASDVVEDNPENNWCTFNPLHFRVSYGMATLSEGDLKFGAAGLSSSFGVAFTTFNLTSGKWYAELRTTGNTSASVGVINVGHYGHDKFLVQNPQNETGNWTLFMDGTDTKSRLNGSLADPNYTAFNNTQVLGIALNADDKELSFFVDGTLQTGLGSSGVIDISTGGGVKDAWSFSAGTFNGSAVVFHWNFGQDSSFGGTETATSNSDGNGIGTFHTAPPSGFLAVCSANLPELTIGPNSGDDEQAEDYFETVLYTGNSTDDRTVAVNFAPDWVWLKSRFTSGGSVHSHFQLDTNRGATNFLKSDTNAAASDDATSLKAFTSTGFTLGNGDVINDTGTSYVAWNWKANGGTTSTLTGGTINSTVQASTKAGFSIVSYTGNATNNATVAHGLSSAPEFVITKSTGATGNWQILTNITSDYEEGDNIELNNDGAVGNSANVTFAPTSTLWKMQGGQAGNVAVTQIAYCFHSVEGYSKCSSYIGNGNVDGAFVFTGFRPAFIIMKCASNGSTNWFIIDNKRDTDNEVRNDLKPNTAAVETANTNFLDFLSNGFKLRTTGAAVNGDGRIILYVAFAEAPFKYANAR